MGSNCFPRFSCAPWKMKQQEVNWLVEHPRLCFGLLAANFLISLGNWNLASHVLAFCMFRYLEEHFFFFFSLTAASSSSSSFFLLAFSLYPYGCGSKPMVPFWGRCTTHVRTYFSGWIGSRSLGLTDLDFEPWPYPCQDSPWRGLEVKGSLAEHGCVPCPDKSRANQPATGT